MTFSTAAVTDLWARGYGALPCPQRVQLEVGECPLTSEWSVAADGSVDPAALACLTAGLQEIFGSPPATANPGARCIMLSQKPGTVAPDASEGIARQGYRIRVTGDRVDVTGNAGAGLFYGVQTLLQMLRPCAGGRAGTLPVGVIEDWPDRELRIIHYDTKHHQDRLESVKDMISRAASFKINGLAWEIEDKFAYEKHPVIGAPGAFTAAQMCEITEHALRHHVEIIPIVQGPSHLAFVLKHEEFAHLREDRANNYMLCPSNDECYELLFSMYDELIAATPGCRYFHVGTDEPYFLGDGVECGCRARREEIGQGGMMAEFIDRCGRYLMDKGREVMCWGEWPMTAKDVHRLPKHIINTVWQTPEMSEAYKEHGHREVIYAPTQGSRPLFPEYFYPPEGGRKPLRRVEFLERTVRRGPCRSYDPLGVLIAAWDDSGLHMESFWMGWALGCSWGWNPDAPAAAEAVAQFCRAFHGPETIRMPAVYRSLDLLTRFWTNAWDQAPSKRGPSYKRQWHPRYDRTLALPHVPEPENLDNRPFFRERYSGLLAEASEMREVLGRLTDMLMENIGRARRNRYSLEVFSSVAALLGDFLKMLDVLAGLEEKLDAARKDVGNVNYQAARAKLAEAAGAARSYVADREATFAELTATWEKSRCPKGQSVDGRDFVHIQDDTKNHHADWTVDLGYLIKPSRDLDIGGWADRLDEAAAEFTKLHPDAGQKWKPGWGFEEDG